MACSREAMRRRPRRHKWIGDEMAYYKKVLQPNENVRYVGKLHWILYRHAIALGILAAVAYAYSKQAAEYESPLLISSWILLLLAAMSFASAWFVRVTTELVVTDKRVIHKVGWIARQTEEINITKVETVDVNQGVLGRVLGFGEVLIKGVGGSWEPLRWVASPLKLRNAIVVG
jgi:uncharacterized membrane protein YdbT with pleckstrin-like domain